MFRRFLYGRYGNDQLGNLTVVLSLVCGVVTFFVEGTTAVVFALLQLILLSLWMMRSFSRNIYARRRENERFLLFFNRIEKPFRGLSGVFSRMKDRKHKYFKCPNCKSRLRVPRGRGEITVTCPCCRTRFDKKS